MASKKNGNGKAKLSNKLTAREAEVLKYLKRQAWSIPGIADSTKPKTSEEEAVRLVDALMRKGNDINLDRATKQVGLKKDPTTLQPLLIDPEKRVIKDPIYRHTYKVGFWSSVVAGSKFAQWTALHTLYAYFEAAGVDFAVGSDLTAGIMPKRRQGEVFLGPPEQQRDYVLKHFPKARFKTYIISGKRDLSSKDKENPAYNIVRGICGDDSRDDLIYRGDLSASFFIKDVLILATNPGEDYAPYANSLPLQRIMENTFGEEFKGGESDKKVLALFGTHMFADLPIYMITRGFLAPTLQAMTPHQRSRRRRVFAPIIGGVILHLHFDDKWHLKENGIEVELVNLTDYQQPDDYLAEVKIKESLTKNQIAVVELLSERPRTEGELSRNLKIHKDKVWEIIGNLQDSNYKILTPSNAEQADSKQFTLVLSPKTSFKPLDLKTVFHKKLKTGYTSDKHYASGDGQPSCVDMAYRNAEEEKIAVMFDTGDMTAGLFDHPANKNKVIIPNVEGQMLYAADRHPKASFPQFSISGDHDSFAGKVGANFYRRIFSAARPDIKYLGHLRGAVEINGMKFTLKHPGGGPGYALTYGGQKHIEAEIQRIVSRGGKEMCHVLAFGNWHVANWQFSAGVAVICVPCFQEQTLDYMDRKALHPWIGMWIMEYTVDTANRITSARAKYYNYAPYTKELDLPEPIASFYRKYVFPDMSVGDANGGETR